VIECSLYRARCLHHPCVIRFSAVARDLSPLLERLVMESSGVTSEATDQGAAVGAQAHRPAPLTDDGGDGNGCDDDGGDGCDDDIGDGCDDDDDDGDGSSGDSGGDVDDDDDDDDGFGSDGYEGDVDMMLDEDVEVAGGTAGTDHMCKPVVTCWHHGALCCLLVGLMQIW